jgi:hypothetical protein
MINKKRQELLREIEGLICYAKIKEEVIKYKLNHNIYPATLIMHPDKYNSLFTYINHLIGEDLLIEKYFSFYDLQIKVNNYLAPNQIILSCVNEYMKGV